MSLAWSWGHMACVMRRYEMHKDLVVIRAQEECLAKNGLSPLQSLWISRVGFTMCEGVGRKSWPGKWVDLHIELCIYLIS